MQKSKSVSYSTRKIVYTCELQHMYDFIQGKDCVRSNTGIYVHEREIDVYHSLTYYIINKPNTGTKLQKSRNAFSSWNVWGFCKQSKCGCSNYVTKTSAHTVPLFNILSKFFPILKMPMAYIFVKYHTFFSETKVTSAQKMLL